MEACPHCRGDCVLERGRPACSCGRLGGHWDPATGCHDCVEGYHGPACTLPCECANGGVCTSGVRGGCRCTEGFTGADCTMECECVGGTCDAAGRCECFNNATHGHWVGPRCDACAREWAPPHCNRRGHD